MSAMLLITVQRRPGAGHVIQKFMALQAAGTDGCKLTVEQSFEKSVVPGTVVVSNLHTYTTAFCAQLGIVPTTNGIYHHGSLPPPCHRARSQPATHPKKACY